MSALLDILSGHASTSYKHELDQAGSRADLRNKTLFDTMVEDRQERRVRDAAGSPGRHQLPFDQEGPQVAGSGYFSDNPDEQILAQILMTNANKAFQPMLTAAAGAPTKHRQALGVQAAKSEDDQLLAIWKQQNPNPPQEGKTYDFKSGDQTVTRVWKDGKFVEAGRGDTFNQRGSGGAMDRTFKNENEMYKTFEGLATVKNYKLIRKQMGRVTEAKQALQEFRDGLRDEDSLIAVDQALITIFNKTLDENSVVRESEYARTQQDQAFVRRLQGGYAKQISDGGAGLTDAERHALIRMIDQFEGVSRGLYSEEANFTRARAASYGFNPQRIVRPKDFEPGQDLNTRLPPKTEPRADELPPGFVDQGDGTALNTETGETARWQ